MARAVCALPGQWGQVLAPTGGFPSGGCFTCPPRTRGVVPGVCLWVWKRSPVPVSGSQNGGSHLCLPPGAPVGSVLLPGSTHRERSSFGGPTPLLMHLPIMVPCLSGGPRLLSTPSVATAQPLQAVSAHLTLVYSLCLTSRASV